MRLGYVGGKLVAQTATMIAGGNPRRRALTFVLSPGGAGRIAFGPISTPVDNVSLINQLTINFVGAQVFALSIPIRYEDFGELVCMPWHAIASSASGVWVGVIEGIEEEPIARV